MNGKVIPMAALIALVGVFATSIGGGLWLGKLDERIFNNSGRIVKIEETQSKIGTVQTEQAVQGAAIENLRGDVSEIKTDQKQLKTDVETIKRQTESGFSSVLDAIENLQDDGSGR